MYGLAKLLKRRTDPISDQGGARAQKGPSLPVFPL